MNPIQWLPPVKDKAELPAPAPDLAAFDDSDYDKSAGSFIWLCDGKQWTRHQFSYAITNAPSFMKTTSVLTKKFGPYPFSHRLPKHGGKCKNIHGHSWYFAITFTADRLTEEGFIIDFGGAQMHGIKDWLTESFDHTLVLSEDDELLRDRTKRAALAKLPVTLTVVPDATCEGLAVYIAESVQTLIGHDKQAKLLETADRNLRVVSVEVWEEAGNSVVHTVATN